MKRSLTLTLLFALIATFSFAQIRIEKRHYNRGWYIALGKDKKEKQDVCVAEKKTTVVAKPVEETTSTSITTESSIEHEVVLESVKPQQSVAKKKTIATKVNQHVVPTNQVVAQQLKQVVAPTKQMQSISKSFSRLAKADPGDGLFSYLFGGWGGGDALMVILVILVVLGLIGTLIELYLLFGPVGMLFIVAVYVVVELGS